MHTGGLGVGSINRVRVKIGNATSPVPSRLASGEK